MLKPSRSILANKVQVKEFIDFHYDLYQGTPQWVPPFYSDMYLVFDKKKHPFYEFNSADFLLQNEKGKWFPGSWQQRIWFSMITIIPEKAQFYYFDSIDDQEAADAIFSAAFQWGKDRKLGYDRRPQRIRHP